MVSMCDIWDQRKKGHVEIDESLFMKRKRSNKVPIEETKREKTKKIQSIDSDSDLSSSSDEDEEIVQVKKGTAKPVSQKIGGNAAHKIALDIDGIDRDVDNEKVDVSSHPMILKITQVRHNVRSKKAIDDCTYIVDDDEDDIQILPIQKLESVRSKVKDAQVLAHYESTKEDVPGNARAPGATGKKISVVFRIGKEKLSHNIGFNEPFNAYLAMVCKAKRMPIAKTRFEFDGEKLDKASKPSDFDMEDGDSVDVS
uniref:Ubiquitin-like domain-containing protein n=1 Tax=Mucochytrium quahogii TaxID=96639 RepID=A0A7S2S7F2_9STRA|mmetsp:Transcript_3256/g.6055  ORF Transcript_3256/g.6055 Transcript_3256/m.6055 type:complete len:255 (-) Transcript_3256:7414-8178(-)